MRGYTSEEVVFGRLIRRLYCAHRSEHDTLLEGDTICYQPPVAYDGKKSRFQKFVSPESKPRVAIWPKLARWFIEQGYDPDIYIEAQFVGFEDKRRIPEPGQLMTRACTYNYKRAMKQRPRRVAMALQHQHAHLQARCIMAEINRSKDDALAESLLDESLSLSALYRYCVARHHGAERFQRIAAVWELEAAVQFHRAREAYLRVWGKMIPRDFVVRSRRIYKEMLERTFG